MNLLRNRAFHFVVLALILATMLVLYQAKEPFAKHEEGMAEWPVAIVNTEEVFLKASAFKDIQKQVEDHANAFQKTHSKKQDQLQEKNKKLESQRAALSDKALEEQVNELNKEFEDINREAYMARLVMDRAYKNALKAVDTHFIGIINDFAKEYGAKLVLNKAQVVFADDSMNITDVVIAQLDKKISSYKLDFKAVEAEVQKSIAQQEAAS